MQAGDQEGGENLGKSWENPWETHGKTMRHSLIFWGLVRWKTHPTKWRSGDTRNVDFTMNFTENTADILVI